MRNIRLVSRSLVILVLLLASCGQSFTAASPTMTAPLPSATATITPTPHPSSTFTPTVTPTPVGGRDGLLLAGHSCHVNSAHYSTECELYIYDIRSRKTSLLLTGYSPIGVSPDGKRVALQRYENDKADIFIIDIAHPEQIALIYEDAIPYESAWFPETEWIGFIAKKDGVQQVFIIHPDGTNLTQITKSKIGASYLYEVFYEGVFWLEGSDLNSKQKWTRLDGTEREFKNFVLAISPDGKSILVRPELQNAECDICNFDLINLEKEETRNISFVNPKPKSGYFSPVIKALSNNHWLVMQYPTSTTPAEYWIYSNDGTILFDFSTLVHKHGAIDAGTQDFYRIIGGGYDLSGQRLSPDGNLFLMEHTLESQIPMQGENSMITLTDSTFHLLNLSTFELWELPGISFDLITSDNSVTVTIVEEFWWVELP